MAPFPWLAMMAISASSMSNVFSVFSLFPYLGYMVDHIGVTDSKDKAGFYSGLIASAFMLGRFLSGYFWGRFADKHGRLPVMYISLASITIISIGFGLSTTLFWAITCRFLLGAMNTIPVISKSMVSEICGREHEMVGMSYLMATWSLSSVIAPGAGGLLAEPAKNFPRYFSETGIFARFPYLLPNIVGATLAVLAMCMAYFFLKETLHSEDVQEHANSDTKDSFCAEAARPWRRLSEKRIRDVMFVYGVFLLVQMGFPSVFPLWALSTVANGGLDWTAEQIGQVLSMVGVSMMVFQMCIYPNMLKGLGVNNTQRWASLILLPLYPCIPMLANLRGQDGSLVISTTIVCSILNSGAAVMTINMSLTMNNMVESGRRGEINGLAMTVSGLTKALGPFMFSVLFAWSISRDRPFPFGPHLVFLAMSICIGIVAIYGWNIIRRDVDEVDADASKRTALTDIPKEGTEKTKLTQSFPAYRSSENDGSAERVKLVESTPV